MAWIQIRYQSEALHMPVAVDAFLPQGRGDYQTLYLLHGAGGDEASWLLHTRLASYVEGTDLAVILPAGRNRFYVKNAFGPDYAAFIGQELPAQCEKWFALSRDSSRRHIAGMSMGGYGAVYAAAQNPQTFATAISYSGLLDVVERYDKPQGLELYPVFGKREDLVGGMENILNRPVSSKTQFLLTCGRQDPRLEMSRKMQQHLEKCGCKSRLILEPGGHDWKYWDSCLEKTVRMLAGKGESEWQLCR